MLLALSALLLQAEAACSTAISAAAVDQRSAAIIDAFAQMDDRRGQNEAAALRVALPCVEEPISPDTAARLHLAMGLAAKAEDRGASDRARLSFAAARSASPDVAPPDSIAPDSSSPVWRDWEAVPLSARVPLPAPPPAEGTLLLDGAEVTTYAAGWPVLLQRQDGGAVLETAYGWSLPDYAVRPEAPTTAHQGRGLLLGAGLATLGGLGLAGTSIGLYRAFDCHLDYSSNNDCLNGTNGFRQRMVRNAIAGGTLAGAGIGLGLGVTATRDGARAVVEGTF